MSIRDKQLQVDGFQALTKGVDSARPPYMLPRDQLAWMVNATTRENVLTCRPGWKKHTLHFLDANGNEDATVAANFKANGRFQGAGSYEADNGDLSLLASIGGRIFLIALATMQVQDLTAVSGVAVNNPQLDLSWFCQAENFCVIQNGQDDALVFDGGTLKRSYGRAKAGFENAGIPIGRQMAYNNGRLWVAVPTSDNGEAFAFVAGDLAYSHEIPSRADILSFTENEFLNGGGAFVLPAAAGPIRAMVSVAVQDNSTGQGPLQIFTTRGCFSINAPFNRDDWQNTTSPIQTISMLASGAVAQAATVNVNGDIWFRSPDGVRSFVIARRDHGTWVNTPLSNEMKRAFGNDTGALLPYASATLFDNRLLVTTNPRIAIASSGSVPRGVVHLGLGVLDFNPVSSMFNRQQPNWDGIWTGLRILQILTVGADNPRCFIFALNSDDEIELWELTRSDRFDQDDRKIEWSFETASYEFEDGGFGLKRLMWADMWIDRLAGCVTFESAFRPDAYPFWVNWHTWYECAQIKDCQVEECGEPLQLQEQYRTRHRLPDPEFTGCDPVTKSPFNLGYRFQVKLKLTGFCRIRQLRLAAHPLPEAVTGGSV